MLSADMSGWGCCKAFCQLVDLGIPVCMPLSNALGAFTLFHTCPLESESQLLYTVCLTRDNSLNFLEWVAVLKIGFWQEHPGANSSPFGVVLTLGLQTN